jgi:hypothetical protein
LIGWPGKKPITKPNGNDNIVSFRRSNVSHADLALVA